MSNESYLQWLVRKTPTSWWHDSADPGELRRGLEHGATGVTTNPLLSAQALYGDPGAWADGVRTLLPGLPPARKAEGLIAIVAGYAAGQVRAFHDPRGGAQGYACAQVNPNRAGDRDDMLGMARRYHAAAPNISVKLPASSAGLDVLEECAAEGITVTMTVSFSVPQVLAAAQRYERGVARARARGLAAGECTSVIMIGRLDEYLRDVAADRRDAVTEADIRQAGLAVVKRAYAAYRAMGTRATLLVAALRGAYHMTGLAGAALIMSIHPKIQAMLLQEDLPREEGIDNPVPDGVIERLCAMPEFRRAYEPDGMRPEDFMSWGLTQRTLTQFAESGWNRLEAYAPAAARQ